ncbi:MAG: protein-L-isoaspartate(D-aspartate) O-methyltransferase [Verrucomicrobia bacterium]|nr:protein-L-isoaspartate(D-aspartate) O-methyltransferase [Verrucomicrobiota bacterium]
MNSTDDFTESSERMVREQLAAPGRDIANPRVLAAMRDVPRHEFVPPELRGEAYSDHALPIGFGQTISQPFIVAFMTETLDPQPLDRVLEIGTGCGYQAAVLSRLVKEVFSIEIVEPLAARAAADLHRLGFRNVHVRSGDGHAGWPEAAPFNAIIVTCAPDHVPAPLVEQLREGGRMMIPIGESGEPQQLVLLEKQHGKVFQREIMAVRFVPMTGAAAPK